MSMTIGIPTGASQIVPVGAYPPPPTGNLKMPSYPGEDLKPEKEWEPEFRETFSKGILKMRMQEYFGGKYTKKYIDTYLEFMVLSGMVNNLEYLEFKGILARESL